MTGLASVDGVIQNTITLLKIIRSSCNLLPVEAIRYG